MAEERLTDTWIDICIGFFEDCGVAPKLPYVLRNDVDFTAPSLLVALLELREARAEIARLERETTILRAMMEEVR